MGCCNSVLARVPTSRRTWTQVRDMQLCTDPSRCRNRGNARLCQCLADLRPLQTFSRQISRIDRQRGGM